MPRGKMAGALDSAPVDSFKVGDSFSSFVDLETRLETYKKTAFVELWKRDCQPDLQYYEVKFCCVHGGQSFKTRGKGVRASS